MKYPNWSQVFANDPNNEAYDKQAKGILDLFLSALSDEDCIDNIKKEPNLIYISIAPITEDMQVFHHLTQIGGNISMPKPHIVALSGFGSSPISIRLHDELFDDSDQVIVPPWKKLEALTSAKEVLALKSTGGSSMDFRNILAVPPSWLIQSLPQSRWRQKTSSLIA